MENKLCTLNYLTQLLIMFVLFRMHLALKAYQELLLTLNEMDRSPDESIRQSSNVIKSKNITYPS